MLLVLVSGYTYHVYLNIRIEFFPNSSSKKGGVALYSHKKSNMFCTDIFLPIKLCHMCKVVSHFDKYGMFVAIAGTINVLQSITRT